MKSRRVFLPVGARRFVGLMLGLVCCLAGSARSAEISADVLLALRSKALAYEHGEGVTRDPLHAVRLYCEGARLGDADAQFNLGWMYANGRGISRDDGLAAYFFGLAARSGHVQAEKMLRFVGEPVSETPACMRTPEDPVEDAFVARTDAEKMVLGLVHKLAPEYGVNPQFVLAVIRAESNFNPMAISSKNAQGLMQLIPDTSVRFNVRRPYDPEQNVRGGMAYLRWLLAYFEGNVALVAAAYNAGEGAVNRFRGIPPYAETRGYVRRIMSLFKKEAHPYDPAITSPSPELARIRNVR